MNMSKYFKFLLSFLMLFTATSASVLAENTEHNKLVRVVIQLSGLDQTYDGFDQILSATINQGFALNSKVTPAQKEQIKSIFLNNYNYSNFMENITNQVSANVDDKQLETLLEHYKHPLVQKFVQAEIASSQPENLQQLAAFAAKLGENPPSKNRLELISRLDRATRATEATKSITNSMFNAMFKSMTKLNPKFSKQEFDESMEKLAPMLDIAIEKELTASYLYTYRNFSDNELDAYTSMHEENDSFNSFHNATLAAIRNYFTSYSANVATDVVEYAETQIKLSNKKSATA